MINELFMDHQVAFMDCQVEFMDYQVEFIDDQGPQGMLRLTWIRKFKVLDLLEICEIRGLDSDQT